MKLCYVNCEWSASIMGEKRERIVKDRLYRFVEESKYLEHYGIIEEVVDTTTSPKRMLVHMSVIEFIPQR